jgi:two-component system, chemotaxis family, sensor kinase CheA
MYESATNNTDQFKQSFREEAREILVELESALLELNQVPGDMEVVSRVFRGLHTIKGSGAMFGFDDLAAFTHDLETAFDAVRSGRLAVNGELVDQTLAALDQIRVLLEAGGGKNETDSAAREKILANVRRLGGIAEPKVQTEARRSDEAPIVPANPGLPRDWHIHFAPGPDLLRCGANPLLLVRELRQLGQLEITASFAAIPPLTEMDPERCYVSWDMVLHTAADPVAIRDVFIFVEDSSDVRIDPVATAPPQPAEPSRLPDSSVTARALEEKRSGNPGRRTYDKADNATSLRVPAAKLDQLVNLVGELVTVQARLGEISLQREDPEIAAVAEEIERLTSSLRENSMNIRMTPIRSTFEKFRRLVHDLARELNKDVELTIDGAETELDKTVIDQLGDPLMHLIRNSMDHGIEPREPRAATGKTPTATIHLCARHSGASVLIEVSDDGRGIDADAVYARAVEKGLVVPGAQLTEKEIFALIFRPGFSTARQVTDVSGRGVGMDVVRQRVESLRGRIEVSSQAGKGTTVTLRLPLTLAIIDGLLLDVAGANFVLPLASTFECIELTRDEIAKANGKHLANVRGEIVPYVRLREHFHAGGALPEIEQIMVVETAAGRYGLVVDRVLGSCQTVIKNLGRFYRQVQIVSGATILGNGSVALILDPERLVQDAARGVLHGPRGQPSIDA